MAGELEGRVALVAGATRGAGRGIAVELGAAGATVYCTGRSTRAARSEYDRPETIEETAELVTAAGGDGVAVAVDHLDPDAGPRPGGPHRRGAGRLDVLVNDIWGGELLIGVEHAALGARPRPTACGMLRLAVDTHLITSHHALPLLIRRPGRAGGGDDRRHRRVQRVDLPPVGVLRPRQGRRSSGWRSRRPTSSRPHGATAVALTPGWMRSEMMLDAFGVTEENWRDATRPRRRTSASRRPRATSGAPSPRSPPTPTWRGGTAGRCRAGGSPRSTGSPTSTAAAPTRGGTWSRCRTRTSRRTPPATAERGARRALGKAAAGAHGSPIHRPRPPRSIEVATTIGGGP